MKNGVLLLAVVWILAACSPGLSGPVQTTPGAGAAQPAGTSAAGQQLFTAIPAFATATTAPLANPPQAATPAPVQPTVQSTAAPFPTDTQAAPVAPAATTAPAATVPAAVPTAPPSAPTAIPTTAAAVAPTAPASVPVTGALVVVPVDELRDFQVVDPNGMRTGEVKDLIVELKNPDGTPAKAQGLGSYLVVQGDFNSDWLIPVPWRVVQVRPDIRAVVLPAAAAQLAAAPGFNEELYPYSLSPQWRSAVQDFWNNPTQPAPARSPLDAGVLGAAPDYIRASKITDVNLFSPQGVKLAEVDDMAIDWANSQPGSDAAKIPYLVLKREDALGPGASLIPVPWRLLPLNPAVKDVVTNIPAQALQAAPGFEKFSWPDLFTAPWAQQLTSYWQSIQ